MKRFLFLSGLLAGILAAGVLAPHVVEAEGNRGTGRDAPVHRQPFGDSYATAVSVGAEATTSSTFQTKVQLVTPPLAQGATYRISWMALVWNDGDLGHQRLYNTTDAMIVTGTNIFKPTDAAERTLIYGFAEVVGTGTAKTYEIQWRDQAGGNSQTISQARIEIWRVE